LVGDDGFDGLVIKIKNSEIKINDLGDFFEITVDAGVLLPQLLAKTLENWSSRIRMGNRHSRRNRW
jgi:hypothetical protein